MEILNFITKRTHLFITLFPLAGISFLFILFVSMNRYNNVSQGPFEVQMIKARCPEEMSRHYRIFGKNITLRSKTRIWYPADPSLRELTTVIMFPATRIQCHGFAWMAEQLASRGFVVTICKHNMRTDWLNIIPGIRRVDKSDGSVHDKDLREMKRFIAGLNGEDGHLAGRLSLQQAGVVSRLALSGMIDDPVNGLRVKELKDGVLLAIVKENKDGILVVLGEEFVSFNPMDLKEDRPAGLRGYLAKWMDLAMNHLEIKRFFPARMIVNLLGTIKEMNMKNYLNIREELFTYFNTTDEISVKDQSAYFITDSEIYKTINQY